VVEVVEVVVEVLEDLELEEDVVGTGGVMYGGEGGG
jgi:hypothetical protein